MTDVRDSLLSKARIMKTSIDTGEKLADAVYEAFTDADCTTRAIDANNQYVIFKTNGDGYSNEVSFEKPCTIYVKETRAPNGYFIDNEVVKCEVKSSIEEKLNTFEMKDSEPFSPPGKKSSASPDMTTNNSCYDLAGAVYEVYCADCNTKVGTTITDSNGNFSKLIHGHWVFGGIKPAETVNEGTEDNPENEVWKMYEPEYELVNVPYHAYIREIKAPKGFQLCTDTHTCDVLSDGTIRFDCVEQPLNDPFSLTLTKMIEDETGDGYKPVSTEGAEFQVEYFTNTDGETDGTPKNKWVFKTDANGKLMCDDESYLVADESDALYKNADGVVVYPLGTYRLTEIKAPKYYQLDGSMCLVGDENNKVNVKTGVVLMIVQNSDGKAQIIGGDGSGEVAVQNLTINSFDKIYRGSVNVTKYDENNAPLSGVTFKLVGADNSEVTVKTDDEGHASFDKLLPQKYVLTEVATADGHNLLKDNIEVTIPLEMTKEEAKKQNADTSKAVWDEIGQCYCFYDMSFEIKNDVPMEVPLTGGNQLPLYVGMAAAFSMIGACTFLIIKRRRVHF